MEEQKSIPLSGINLELPGPLVAPDSHLVDIENSKYIRELARGGFGKTNLHETPEGKRFVVKTLDPSRMNDRPKALEMFRAEYTKLEKVGNHAQIPSFMGYRETDGVAQIAQQYIPGLSLREVFDTDELFTSERAQRLLADILPPLEHLHQNKVIHRDIKPANIIIDKVSQLPFLVDFGASKLAATETALAHTGTVVGSGSYMPPEQAGGNGTYQSDFFSLGVTIIESMVGFSPVAVGNWEWEAACEVDPGFARILRMMCHWNLRDRFRTVAQIRRELDDLKVKQNTPSIESDILKRIEAKKRERLSDPRNTGRSWVKPVAGGIILLVLGSGVGSVLLGNNGELQAPEQPPLLSEDAQRKISEAEEIERLKTELAQREIDKSLEDEQKEATELPSTPKKVEQSNPSDELKTRDEFMEEEMNQAFFGLLDIMLRTIPAFFVLGAMVIFMTTIMKRTS